MSRRKLAEPVMPAAVKKLRCAVYTRKSTDEGLDKEFNTLDAQREACEAYIASQRAEGWVLVHDRYDDGGASGGTLDRPALKRLLADIEAGLVDVVVVYKIDRLSRSLMDFARLVEAFEAHNVTFVSVAQSFNTTTPPQARVDPALVKALARTHRWKRMLEEGRYASIGEVAAAEKLDRGYVGRLLRLTLLAPDLVEAILDGRQSAAATLPALLRPSPVDWREQRAAWAR
jgi:DNA invertase Pin-like site-specific DNA recombinase